MQTAYFYLAASGVLTVLMWTPYILSRMFVWGIPTFLNNYPKDYPREQPAMPLWAERSKRAHLNMVETMPAFIAVIIAAGSVAPDSAMAGITQRAAVIFYTRIAHAVVYTLGIPYLRTPIYLISWIAILAIGVESML